METTQLQVIQKNERLAMMVESYLNNPSAYRLLAVLASVSRRDLREKNEFIDLTRRTGAYTDEAMGAIGRLILGRAAGYFKEVVDQVRDEQVTREITEMLDQQVI